MLVVSVYRATELQSYRATELQSYRAAPSHGVVRKKAGRDRALTAPQLQASASTFLQETRKPRPRFTFLYFVWLSSLVATDQSRA